MKTIYIWESLLDLEEDTVGSAPYFNTFEEAEEYLVEKYGQGLTFLFPDNYALVSRDGEEIGKLHPIDPYTANEKVIKIPICNMVIKLSDPRRDAKYGDLPAYNAGTITSQLKEACPVCEHELCYRDCAGARDGGESEEDCDSRQSFNDAVDGMEALILAYACAGGDVENLAFIEAIETAYQAIENNT